MVSKQQILSEDAAVREWCTHRSQILPWQLFETPWSDGTTHLIFSPAELIEKLAALVPPPRQNLVRYHGVLAPNAKLRSAVVPKKPDKEDLAKTRGKSKNRLLWAILLARTFNLQVEICSHCHGKMRVVAAITDGASIKKYLDGVGLPSEGWVSQSGIDTATFHLAHYFKVVTSLDSNHF